MGYKLEDGAIYGTVKSHNILNIVSFDNEPSDAPRVKDIFIYVNLMDISFHLQHQ